ncbi:MAG: PGF-pre-PGF domain-containing protein [archaeon]
MKYSIKLAVYLLVAIGIISLVWANIGTTIVSPGASQFYNANFTAQVTTEYSASCTFWTNDTTIQNTAASMLTSGLNTTHNASVNASVMSETVIRIFFNCTNTTNSTDFNVTNRIFTVDRTTPATSTLNTTSGDENTAYNITANYSDSVGVTSCIFMVDGNNNGTMSRSGTVASVLFTFEAPGNYTALANCTDAAGNYNASSLTAVTIADVIPPINVALVYPANGTTLNTGSFSLNYTVNIFANCTTSVWNSTGGMYSDGTVNGSGTMGFDMSGVDDGNYSWNVYCVDATNGSNDGWGNSTLNWTFTINVGDIQVVKSSPNDAYEVEDIITYAINITNTLSRNLTSIWLTDYPDIDINFTNQSSCAVYNYSAEFNNSYVNINVTSCIGSDLAPNESFVVYLNFTAIMSAPTVSNTVFINAVDNMSNNFSVDDTKTVGITQPEVPYDEGLSDWQSSIVSPYVLKNVPKLLNFSIYRQASDNSCLNNLTIILPANFTFHGYNDSSVGPGNYTFINNSNTLLWSATTDDFFCGQGPENFIINVSSGLNYSSYDFQVIASSDEFNDSSMNLTVFVTTTFWYNGTVFDLDGQPLEGAVASLVVLSFGQGGDVSVGTFTDTTDSDGIFYITSVPGLNESLEGGGMGGPGGMGGLFYRLTAVKYNDSDNHYGMYVGPSLPELPESELRTEWGLADPDIYLKEAVTFRIQVEGYDYESGPTNDSLCNQSGCQDSAFNWTYLGYNYGLKDKRLGFPVSSEHSTQSTERYIVAPLDRNYSLMVFPSSSFPIYVDFESIETNCNATGYDLSSTGVNATCTIQNGTYFIDAVISANKSISAFNGSIINMTNLTSFKIVPYMLAMGEMIFDQDTLPFNMGQMMRWPKNNTAYDDSYNLTTGAFSVFLPATEAHSDIMLMAFAEKDGVYYYDLYNLSADGQVFGVSNYNFTMGALINGTDFNISVNNVSAEWDETVLVTTKAVQFNLVDDNGSLLSTESSFIEMKLETNGIEYNRMTNAADGVFELPILEGGAIKKLTIYSQSYAPVSTPVSAAVLSGATATSTINCTDGVCNIIMVGFGDFDPFGEGKSIFMDFYKSNSSCDVPNPPAGCNMMGDMNESMNSSVFSPLRAILMGDISLRITSGNISVHYVKTDLLASGPPDAAFSENFTGSDISAAWKFGSQGPEIYDEVLLSVPYEDALIDETIIVTIPILYDNEFNPIWNKTAGDTITDIETDSSLEDYLDYLDTDYEAYLNGTGVICSETDEDLSTGLCYKDTSNQVVWIKIPHFSGIGAVVANFSLYNASLLIWDETDNASLPLANQTREVGDQVIFFANYTNRTSYEELNDSIGLCVITFATAPNGPYNMAWNTTNNLWQYNRSFNSTGDHTWNVTCNSSEYQTLFATDTVNITDVTAPTIEYTDATEANDAYKSQDWIFIEVNVTEANVLNTTFYLYNSDNITLNTTASTTTLTATNGTSATFTNATDGVYYYQVAVYDTMNHSNFTATRSITLDTTNATVTFNAETQSDDAIVNQTWININVTVIEVNLKNVTISLYNSSGLVANTTVTSLSATNGTSTNFTGLESGSYNYSVTVTDLAGNSYTTAMRNITLKGYIRVFTGAASYECRESCIIYINVTNGNYSMSLVNHTVTLSASDTTGNIRALNISIEDRANQTGSAWIFNGTNTSVYNDTALPLYAAVDGNNATLNYKINITKNNNTGTLVTFFFTTNNTAKTINLTVNLTCTESWSYGTWSSCTSSSQSRTATDANGCGTTNDRGALTRSCSSGTSGGSTTRTTTTFASQLWTRVTAREKNTMSIANTGIGFTGIEFTTKGDLNDVRLRVETKGTTNPTTIDTGRGKVFQYLEVSPSRMTDDDIDSAKIQFRISRTWMITNNVDIDSIALFRYANGKWNKLTTSRLASDEFYFNFDADTPGFSYFAIAGDAVAEPEEADETHLVCRGGACVEVDGAGENECTTNAQCAVAEEKICGNNAKESGEQCDGTDFGGETCAGLGFESGTVTCDDLCKYDTSACVEEGTEPEPLPANKTWTLVILIIIAAFIVYLFWAHYTVHGKKPKEPKHHEGHPHQGEHHHKEHEHH